MLIKDRNTVSLFHFDESVSKDECGLPWYESGELSLSTDIHRFGNSSLNTTKGGYLYRPSVCNFGYNDFTIDCWIYVTTDSGDGWKTIISAYGNLRLFIKRGYFWIYDSQGSYLYVIIPGNFENRWHHYACVRKDGKVYLFVDGKLQIAKAWALNCVTAGDGNTYIGTDANSVNYNKLNSYLDELRISNIARWTNDFTPMRNVNRLYEDKKDNYYGILKE